MNSSSCYMGLCFLAAFSQIFTRLSWGQACHKRFSSSFHCSATVAGTTTKTTLFWKKAWMNARVVEVLPSPGVSITKQQLVSGLAGIRKSFFGKSEWADLAVSRSYCSKGGPLRLVCLAAVWVHAVWSSPCHNHDQGATSKTGQTY